MTDCPTPQKLGFKSYKTARRMAVQRAMTAYRAHRDFTAMYGYRCICGKVHMTSRRKWDEKKHILLARLRPAKLLAERAYSQGRMDVLVDRMVA